MLWRSGWRLEVDHSGWSEELEVETDVSLYAFFNRIVSMQMTDSWMIRRMNRSITDVIC